MAGWQKKLQESREVVTTQLMGLSQIMLDLARDVRQGLSEQQRIKINIFILSLVLPGGCQGEAG